MVFPVVLWMWELDYKESWAPKNWCFWTVVLEKTLESPLDCKEIQPVHPKGDQSWVFIGRADVEAETPIFWPPDVKSWLIWKDSDVGKDWRWEEKGTTEDEMVWWHHWLSGMDLGRLQQLVMDREAWRAVVHGACGSQRVGHDWATELNCKVAQTRLSVHFLLSNLWLLGNPSVRKHFIWIPKQEKSTPNRQQSHSKHTEWVQNSNNN